MSNAAKKAQPPLELGRHNEPEAMKTYPTEAGCQPVRIQRIRHIPGWRKPPNTICVTRPGRWGNPFKKGEPRPDGGGVIADNAEAVLLFERHPAAGAIRAAAGELRGRNLACWCKVGSPCHGDVLLRLANAKGGSQ